MAVPLFNADSEQKFDKSGCRKFREARLYSCDLFSLIEFEAAFTMNFDNF